MSKTFCKIECNGKEVKVDKETLENVLGLSGTYALEKVFGDMDDAKKRAEKAGINFDALLDLIKDILAEAMGMTYGLLFHTTKASKELTSVLDMEVGEASEEEYKKNLEEKEEGKVEEFKGGIC